MFLIKVCTKRLLNIWTTTLPLLGRGSCHLTLVDPRCIKRALVRKTPFEPLFFLHLKLSLGRIPIFGSYFFELLANLLKLLLPICSAWTIGWEMSMLGINIAYLHSLTTRLDISITNLFIFPLESATIVGAYLDIWMNLRLYSFTLIPPWRILMNSCIFLLP